MATPRFVYVTGEANLSASLAAATSGSIVQVDTLSGGQFATSGSYYTGFEGHDGTPAPTSSIELPDNRTFRIVFNS